MKKRIFVGLGINEKLQNEISLWQKKYESLPVRWVAPKDVHVTLIPPWYEADVKGVIKTLQSIKGKLPAFEFSLKTISFGPKFSNPRLIWATGDTPSGLIRLKKELENLLPVKPEKRKYQLHATLARFRPEEYRLFSEIVFTYEIVWDIRVTSFQLFESRLSSKGATYESLAEIYF